jgi:hypothetical protein
MSFLRVENKILKTYLEQKLFYFILDEKFSRLLYNDEAHILVIVQV